MKHREAGMEKKRADRGQRQNEVRGVEVNGGRTLKAGFKHLKFSFAMYNAEAN